MPPVALLGGAWAEPVGWADLPDEPEGVFKEHAVTPGTLHALLDRCTGQRCGADHFHFLGADGQPVPPGRAKFQLVSRRDGVPRRCMSVVQILYAWRVSRCLTPRRPQPLTRVCPDELCVNPLHYRARFGRPERDEPRAVLPLTTVGPSQLEALRAALSPTMRETAGRREEYPRAE